MSAVGQFWQKVTPTQLKRIVAAIALLIVFCLAVVVIGQVKVGAGGGASTNRSASDGVWRSPASIFDERSPGRRDDGLVFWVKKRLAGLSQTRPAKPRRERVLPVTRSRPVLTIPAFTPEGSLSLLGMPSPVITPTIGSSSFAPAIPAFTAPGFEGLLDLPPSSGGRGSEGTSPLPPGPAVPELATWLQMVLAIGMAGLVLRRSAAEGRGGATLPAWVHEATGTDRDIESECTFVGQNQCAC